MLYIGKGIVAGTDVSGVKYEGRYIEADGRMKGTVTMTAPPNGALLVTGQNAPGGAKFDLTFNFPADSFADGTPQQMFGVEGRPIQIIFEKVTDGPQ